MADPPLIQLEPGGTAPVVRYDIPEPTGYEGKNFIRLDFEDDVFTQAARAAQPVSRATPLENQSTDQVRTEVAAYLRTGSSRRSELPSLPVTVAMRPAGDTPLPPPPDIDDDVLDGIADQVAQGFHVVKGVDLFGSPLITTVPVPPQPDPHLYLVETLRMTSFLGDYGAGRIVKTFTLLPGEVTKISVKTYRQRESTRKDASSVLDSLTQESATDLEKSLTTEQSDQRSFQQTKEYYADAEASAGWGWGSASVKAGVKGSTNAAREESVKNVSNATEKHSARASAKREVEINTSYEVTDKEGEELATERQVENINLSRTLNFVFRQMNQEFVTFLHLTDVRIGYFDGHGSSRREYPLSGLEQLLAEVVDPAHRGPVRDVILEQLSAVRNRDGVPIDVVDEVEVTPGDVYRRFDTELTAGFTDERGRSYEVPGVLLKVDRRVMRTEGVIVEALLGNGPALDGYAEQLQQLEVERREAEVAKEQAQAAQVALVNQVIDAGDETKGAIAAQLLGCTFGCHCCCCADDSAPAGGSGGVSPGPAVPAPQP
ncbi:hypothetical protein [Nocardioides euryhalodurans]|uniref:Uncharacterized protein n=1 Tax=Nocardioides euryhalodurans TaxID=2518370 RepID=A0A4P7GKH9_9ACTN|nr:hypothetical protein [Nocardioides euryhalodurans]QBR92277.1 hypothetical protein EXE57_08230 [Nocardioides euryhalodurans]